MSNRKIRKEIKYNAEEYNVICRRSAALGMRTGTYIRTISVQGSIKHFDFKEVNRVYIALCRIGNNLNQIAAVANSSGSVFQKDVEDMKKQMEDLSNVMDNWLTPLKWEEIL